MQLGASLYPTLRDSMTKGIFSEQSEPNSYTGPLLSHEESSVLRVPTANFAGSSLKISTKNTEGRNAHCQDKSGCNIQLPSPGSGSFFIFLYRLLSSDAKEKAHALETFKKI